VTFDAVAQYRLAKGLAAQVNGYNLANRYYFANSYFSSPVENHVVPGAGRTGLVTVTFAY
jgi:catecholate siderophore receptor